MKIGRCLQELIKLISIYGHRPSRNHHPSRNHRPSFCKRVLTRARCLREDLSLIHRHHRPRKSLEVARRSDLAAGFVALDDLDSVRVMPEEAGDGETVIFLAAEAPVHCVDVPMALRMCRFSERFCRIVLHRVAARTHRMFESDRKRTLETAAAASSDKSHKSLSIKIYLIQIYFNPPINDAV
ncbi:hypothetical protein F2Q70_00019795 [Brassica cretica]|uniref:Uncharacterized protein n=1 Tax=Brassica cretica TaxID=69181 RepID=A0A8S9GU01_BRACR|nr:hypothetical protein F2Q70_00019795 [Brassica cretica]